MRFQRSSKLGETVISRDREGALAVLDPEAAGAAREVAGDRVEAEAHQLGHVEAALEPLELGGAACVPARRMKFDVVDVRAAADAARRRSRSTRARACAPRRCRSRKVRSTPPRHEHVGARRQPVAVEGARAGPRGISGSSTMVDQRRRDRASPRGRRGSSLRRQIAPPEITPASWPTSAAARLGSEHHRHLAGRRSCATPSLATVRRAASRPTASGSPRPPAKRDARPVEAVALLAVGVVADRLDRRARRTCRGTPPEKPAEVANATAPTLRPKIAPSELVTRVSNLRAAASPRARAPQRPRRRRATAPRRPTDRARARSRASSSRAGSSFSSDRARRARASSTVSRANRSSAAGEKSDV